MNLIFEEALTLHEENQGKLVIKAKIPVHTAHELSLVYSPGVAAPCWEIYKVPEKVYDYTIKGNLVAVASNGTAVLGLGNIGAKAAVPVMEGKSVLFKEFGGVDAFPICIEEEEPEEFVKIIKKLSPVFGGINLEDIKAPECFYIEERLKRELDIPVFHDDQHGTAIVTLAGLINALKVTERKMKDIKVVVSGAGAAGNSITKLLFSEGVRDIVVLDHKGTLYEGREGMNESKKALARITNRNKVKGGLEDAIKSADVFIGVSVADILTQEMIRSMAKNPIIFALANPDPEIKPELAHEAGAYVVATGRSDYPNQINNVLAFPGIFRGALDVRAKEINEEMKKTAAYALADLVSQKELSPEYVIPKPFNKMVGPNVAAAVAEAAVKTGAARVKTSYNEELKRAQKIINLK